MAKKNNLTEEQLESIQNYGKDITTLEDFVKAVRTLPGMFIGHKGNKGYINMFREIFQNGFDEIMRPFSPCNMLKISFDEVSCTCVVEDNGRGIPYDNIIRIFNSEYTSSNYKKEKGQYSSGMHGAGAKITNALSTSFIVESFILGEGRRVEFTDGKPWDKGELKIPNKENRQGTIISFVPSFEVMGKIDVTANDILALVQLLAPLSPIGTKFYFKAILNNGKEINTTISNNDGLLGYMINTCKSPLIKPIVFSNDNGDFRANVVLEYDADISIPETIIAFSNFCPTDVIESDHVKGFIAGLKKYFTTYMNKVFLNTMNTSGKKKKKKTLTVIESDIRTGMRVAIDAACLEPLFTGQAKEILSVPAMKDYMAELTFNALDEWGKSNPQELQKMCKYFKDIAEVRSSTDEKKVKLSNQYSSTAAGYPSKFCKPTKTLGDFYIVEGDSAGGSFKTNRDNDTQGVFPIRGMIINCFQYPEKKCLENAEVAGILQIIGGGYGKNFDINKVKWDKVITCFTEDTRVRTSNANTDYMTFKELTEYSKANPDEDIWVYSYDINTGEYCPAIAKEIGIKEYVNKIAKVTLDNGGIITCTLDHRFLTKDRGYVEAQDLTMGESLVTLYTKPDNHKVKSVEIYDLEQPIPMYCLSVSGFQNFAVCDNNLGSVIVHNCGDADAAGAEINALLLRMVLRFCPELILAGKFYRAVAPLYYIKREKNKQYFTDRIELVKYIQKDFSKKNVLTTIDDKKLSPSAIQELLYNNIDYIYELEKIANLNRIQPDILEMYLNNRNLSPEKIAKVIKKKYRFMDMVNINGHITCDGIANGKSNTLIMGDRLLNESTDIIKIIDSNLYKFYKVNGELCSILDIMKLYANSEPAHLNRLKGLGEQSPEELAESVILPGDMGNRTLLQYTMDSAMKEIEQIRHFESNKNKLLEGLVVNRIDVAD